MGLPWVSRGASLGHPWVTHEDRAKEPIYTVEYCASSSQPLAGVLLCISSFLEEFVCRQGAHLLLMKNAQSIECGVLSAIMCRSTTHVNERMEW